MSKLRDFFKGAWDSEETPVEAPITEDVDKAADIRKVIAELLPMVPEEKLESLVGTLKDLAYAKPDVTVDPTAPAKDELNAAEAFKAGENDQIRKEEREEIPGGKDNTAEMVAAGENYERDKLMSEHMDVEDAWKACGYDSDDPAVEAFTKGFAWGMKDGEKDGREEEARIAQDAAIDARVEEIGKALEAKFEAAEEVGRQVGSLRALAFDSANDIYIHGLKEMGIPAGMYSAESARDVFRMAVKMAEKPLAQDSKPVEFSGKFGGLNNIR